MTFKILVKATELPVSLEMAKTYLRIQHAEEDELLKHFLKTAVEWVQESTGKSLLKQTCQYIHANQHFFLPYGPIIKITEVTVRNKLITLEHYDVDPIRGHFVLELPLFKRSNAKVSVTYEAGFGEKPEDVPEAIRNAILTTVAYLYENQGASIKEASLSKVVQPWIQYHKEYHLS